MTTPTDVLNVARRYIGLKEYPFNSNMTPFGAWYGVNGVAWCAEFVSFCFAHAGMTLKITTDKGFSYCPYGVNFFKKAKKFFDKPQVGDIVFYDWSGSKKLAEHTGIVSEILINGNFKAIEGNTSNGNDSNGGEVMERNRNISMVVGFGRPDYDGITKNPPTYPIWSGRFYTLTSPQMSNQEIGTWKHKMIEKGWKLTSDNVFDEITLKVLKDFQKKKGLKVDGILGAHSWNAAWE